MDPMGLTNYSYDHFRGHPHSFYAFHLSCVSPPIPKSVPESHRSGVNPRLPSFCLETGRVLQPDMIVETRKAIEEQKLGFTWMSQEVSKWLVNGL